MTTALAPRPKQPLELIRPIAAPSTLIEAHKDVTELIKGALERKRDYGLVPGTDREVLFKAGAERLCVAFGCYPVYEIIEKEIDHDRIVEWTSTKWAKAQSKPAESVIQEMIAAGTGRFRKDDGGFRWYERQDQHGTSRGLYRYIVRCKIMRRDGITVGEAIGSASTLETKYVRSPRDAENTVLKMAEKRAHVGATLNAFGLSDRFTQDVDDAPPADSGDVVDSEVVDEKKEQPPKKAPRSGADRAKEAVKQAAPPPTEPRKTTSEVLLAHLDAVDAATTKEALDQVVQDRPAGLPEKWSHALGVYESAHNFKLTTPDEPLHLDEAEEEALNKLKELRAARA